MEAILFIDTSLLSADQQSVAYCLSEIVYYRKYLEGLLVFYDKIDVEMKKTYAVKRKKYSLKIKSEIKQIQFHIDKMNNRLVELSAASIINEGVFH